MEVAYPPGLPSGAHLDHSAAAMAVDEMDIDIDIDLEPIDGNVAFETMRDQPPEPQINGFAPSGVSQTTFEDITPHKIHIRGLDDLSTGDITSYLTEHNPNNSHSRIEWVDDTSANIVYPTPASALKALEHIIIQPTSNGATSNLQLRAAKPLSTRPDANLQVRTALVTDQKRPRAYEASKFYMMHPDLDPREKARKEKTRDGSSDYRRRRYGNDEQRRRRKNDRDQGFDASMYDDNDGATAGAHEHSHTRRSSSSIVSVNSSEEAVSPGDRRSRRRGDYFRPGARDRSASPDMKQDENAADPTSRRPRRRTPPPSFNKRSQAPVQNAGKELFPVKPTMSTAFTGDPQQELFPNKKLAANLKKELFPGKPHSIHHRRSDAFDAADATADLFANRLAFTNSPAVGEAAKAATSSYGRLNAPPELDSAIDDQAAGGGLNIRGASKQSHGFTIRGIAADGTRVGVIKELFPDKTGSNLGKELFAEKLEGRGIRRNRAADMFH